MIEKLKWETCYTKDAFEKINEIIDYLNEEHNAEKSIEKAIEDPYSRQRRWLGKACWFWDNGAKDKAFGQLMCIADPEEESKEAPFRTNFGQWYDNCEPVKLNDDIIYQEGKK